jgi:ferredoxin, 2Fe-2S
MTRIVFQHPDGEVTDIDASAGLSVMQAALAHNVSGVIAECGGSAACATCHVYVVSGPSGLFPEISMQEDQMLDCTAEERQPQSRLSCQLKVPVTDETFVIRIPEQQI